LIGLGIAAPLAIGRADEAGPSDGSAALSDRQSSQNDGGPATSSSPGTVRSPARCSFAPWADPPPRDSSVAPWPQRTGRQSPTQNYYWGAPSARPNYGNNGAAQFAEQQSTAPQSTDARVAANSRQRRDVRLTAHAMVDADQPMPARPQPDWLPPPPASVKRSTEPQMGPGMVSGEFGPAQSCDSPRYWIPEEEFPLMGKWIIGAEALLVRPHQNRDTAYEISPNGGAGPDIQNVNFDAKYNAALRAFIGWQLDCDRSLKLTYTYIFDDRTRSADVPDGSVILSPIGADLNPGDTIDATQHIRLQTWDIDSVRKIALPGAVCDACPGWDASWSWGIRIIDVEETITNNVTGPDAETLMQKSTFVGAGPRIGFELRRQLGCARVMAFVGADTGLLLGGQKTIGSNTPSGFDSEQLVPDFDLRLGVCWQPRPEIAISTGWMFETFGDAVMLNQDTTLATVARPQASSLSYDGLFVRGEFHF